MGLLCMVPRAKLPNGKMTVTTFVEAIFVTQEGGAAMRSISEAEAVPGGLKGDRYFQKNGYWSGTDDCEVTLISAEDLDAIERETGIVMSNGQHRRNIVLRGQDLGLLVGRLFRLGEATMVFDRLRPPCAYIQQLTGEKGITRALAGKSGVGVRVIEGGSIRCGDSLKILGRSEFVRLREAGLFGV